jgi:hypothetical protein
MLRDWNMVVKKSEISKKVLFFPSDHVPNMRAKDL